MYYCEECQQEVVACSHGYGSELEPLLRDVDVLGKPGVFWTIIGTAVVFATLIWTMVSRR